MQEMLSELIFLSQGCPVGYGNVKTLTDASVRNCEGDLRVNRTLPLRVTVDITD